jgi:hypothetical protein
MTAPGEKNSLSHQTTWAVSTVLALFGFSDVLTVLVSSGIEQLLVIMRIAASVDICVAHLLADNLSVP